MRKTLIIAEAGVNHNGSLDLALQMVRAAAESGADWIKFQTFVPELIVAKSAQKAEYQKKATGSEGSQLDMLRKLALPQADFRTLQDACAAAGIGFLSTPFDDQSLTFLNELDMPAWKIPSGEITNLPYLIRIARTLKPVILSTGMSTLAEVEAAVAVLRQYGTTDITLLHCTTEYPAPFADVNLKAIQTLRDHFNLPAGYSDHTQGIEISIAAAALGACVIEKHFTLDRTMEGPDHKASLEPAELKAMVAAIRHVEQALGDGFKTPSAAEVKNLAIARKSIVASRPIQQGELFSVDNLVIKRPGSGISPMRWFEVLGQPAVRNFDEDELIEL
jgi:N,N'-diacetyllegionaminate synthase